MTTRCMAIPLSLLLIAAPSTLHAATIARDYLIPVKFEDISHWHDGTITLHAVVDDLGAVEVREGDTFTGTIRFSTTFGTVTRLPTRMVTKFFFSQDAAKKIDYYVQASQQLIDRNGNALNSYEYLTYGKEPFLGVSTAIGGVSQDATVAGMKFSLNFWRLKDGNGTDVASLRLGDVSFGPALDIASAVPEPSSWAMMMLGMTGVGVTLRHRRKRASVAFA